MEPLKELQKEVCSFVNLVTEYSAIYKTRSPAENVTPMIHEFDITEVHVTSRGILIFFMVIICITERL